MRIAFWLVSCLTLALSSFAPLQVVAQSEDPSELFLKAYMAWQQGDRFAENGKFKEARSRLLFAQKTLNDVARTYPDWQSLIVEHRGRKVNELLVNVEERMSLDDLAEDDYQLPAAQTGEVTVTPGTPDTIRRAILVNPEELPSQPGPPEQFPENPGDAPAISGGSSSQEVMQLKAQIEDLTTALQKSEGQIQNQSENAIDPAELERLKEEKAKLETQLTEQQAELEKKVVDVKTELEKEVAAQKAEVEKAQAALEEAQAAKEKEVEAAVEEQKKELETLQEELTAANEKLTSTSDELADVKTALETSQAAEKELQAKLDGGTDELRREKEGLAERLTATNLQLAAIAVERDELEVALEAANKEITELRATVSDVDELRAENQQLLTKLQEFEDRFANLQNDPEKVHQQLEDAQMELSSLRQELAETKAKNAESESTIDQLKNQLDVLKTDLTKAQIAGGDVEQADRIINENQLLRDIVLGQLREERRRTAAGQLLMDEVMKIEDRSELLMAKLEEVTQPIIVLNEEERKLFREPTITISEEQFDTMAVSIALNKPVENPMGEANLQAARSVSPDEGATPPLTTVDGQVIDSATEIEGSEETPSETTGTEATESEAAGPLVETTVKPKVPADLMPLAEEAREYFELGQYRQAEKAYEKILARAPENLYALSNLGVVQFRDGKPRQAELTLKKAVKAEPNDAFAHTTLGIVYFKLGKFDDAIEVLTQSITINPRSAQAHNYLGMTADMKGWPQAAEEEIQKAIALNPDYADAHFNLAVVYAKQDPPMKELARRHYEKALALGSPPDPLLEKLIN